MAIKVKSFLSFFESFTRNYFLLGENFTFFRWFITVDNRFEDENLVLMKYLPSCKLCMSIKLLWWFSQEAFFLPNVWYRSWYGPVSGKTGVCTSSIIWLWFLHWHCAMICLNVFRHVYVSSVNPKSQNIMFRRPWKASKQKKQHNQTSEHPAAEKQNISLSCQ